MKPSRMLALAAFALPLLAHAHPGHDESELTWDFDHLVSHPAATALCLVVLGAGVWGAWRLVRSRRAAGSVVRSQPVDRR